MIFGLLAASLTIAGAAYGFYRGYEYGVKETEQRWSDAVARMHQ